MNLHEFSYLTLAETADWLKIDWTVPTNVTKYTLTLTRLINTATKMVESYIGGPVLTRVLREFRDGNSSDVVTPTYHPVRKLLEVRIDYNRGFDATTIVLDTQTVLRGMPEIDQAALDADPLEIDNAILELRGSDIVLRDDNNTALLGRIFAGSIVQSIQLTYRAGWGDTADTIPADLVQATLMLVEYFYMLRENRDLGVNSRNNNNQGYRRDRNDSGIPPEIELILDQYKDYSLGITDVPQKNTFTL